MQVKSVPSHDATRRNVLNNNPSFGGNPVISTMEFVDRKGFVAAFLIGDTLGLVAPRLWKGINRGRKDEHGHPVIDRNTGRPAGYNWEFARKEAIRELLSGPSIYVIPLAMLAGIKKFGSANGVKAENLHAYKGDFAAFAQEHRKSIDDLEPFYKRLFKNVIKTSTEGLSEAQIDDLAERLKNSQLHIDDAIKAAKTDKKSPVGELQSKLVKQISDIRKQHASADSDLLKVELIIPNEGKTKVTLSEFIGQLPDYTSEAVAKVKKYTGGNVEEMVHNFTHRRTATRTLTNFGMWGAVIAFFAMIPKLYNMGLKSNPGLKGTAIDPTKQHKEHKHANKAKDVSFGNKTSWVETVGKKLRSDPKLKTLTKEFEFNGPGMSSWATAALLYGFCFPTRMLNAQDKYDKAEIITRDISSFTALIFGGAILRKLVSEGLTKFTGFALNSKPESHNTPLMKFWNYINPAGGVSPFGSGEIEAKYSDIAKYKDGMAGFCDFVKSKGGDIEKVLLKDKEIKAAAEAVMGRALKGMGADAIRAKFADAQKADKNGTKEYRAIIDLLKDANNKLVRSAKTMNHFFNFTATFLLIPAFMIWLANYCEHMTKRGTAKDVHKGKVQPQAAKA